MNTRKQIRNKNNTEETSNQMKDFDALNEKFDQESNYSGIGDGVVNKGMYDSNVKNINYKMESMQNNINNIFEKLLNFKSEIERIDELERLQEKSEEDIEIIEGKVRLRLN